MQPAYHRPSTITEALALKRAEPAARFIAGGTDILVQMRKRRTPPAPLISLNNVVELRGVAIGDKIIRIGAATPLADLLQHDALCAELPALAMALATLASQQIRNVATAGGNLCNASPCADPAPALMVHDAKVELARDHSKREVPLPAFLVGPGRTTREPDELVSAIVVPRPSKGARSAFLRHGRVAMDLSLASVAVLVELDGRLASRVRVCAGAVGPVPMRLVSTEALLQGRTLDAEAVRVAAEDAAHACAPINDLRASANYRRRLVRVLLERALTIALGNQEASRAV